MKAGEKKNVQISQPWAKLNQQLKLLDSEFETQIYIKQASLVVILHINLQKIFAIDQ